MDNYEMIRNVEKYISSNISLKQQKRNYFKDKLFTYGVKIDGMYSISTCNVLYTHLEIYYIPNTKYRNWNLKTHYFKYRNSDNVYFMHFKNKKYKLEHTIAKLDNGLEIIAPIIPDFVFEHERKCVEEALQKERDKLAKKLGDNLDISGLSGELIFLGIDNEVTIKENCVFIHNFQKALLKIKRNKTNYTLYVANNASTNSSITLGEYSKEELLDKLKTLKDNKFL